MVNQNNIILLSDGYKFVHQKTYPPGTEKVYSYFESRGGKFDNTVFFGLQYFIKEYLEGVVVTNEMIDEAKEMIDSYMGKGIFNEEGWRYIANELGGKLPIEIKGVPEGTVVFPTKNVLMTMENTDPKCFWLTNFLETLGVQICWYMTTVATLSRECKKVIKRYLDETGDPEGLPFKLHDFGFRGVSSVESAGTGGCAHLVNFMGSDTVQALRVAKEYYNEPMAAQSIPAAEHSNIVSWGRENEMLAYENMLKQFKDYPLVAVVSDSYDIYNACDNIWGRQLKNQVLEHKGTIIIRPDSGNPVEVVLDVLRILGMRFGTTFNEKGFKVLNPHVRVIQGDGVNMESIEEILETMKVAGWSADNVAFGMGGALLQGVDRDTLEFAFKASYIEVNGVGRDVYKQPVTSDMKVSKKGRLALIVSEDGSGYTTVPGPNPKDILQTVFLNGELTNEVDFGTIRKRAEVI